MCNRTPIKNHVANTKMRTDDGRAEAFLVVVAIATIRLTQANWQAFLLSPCEPLFVTSCNWCWLYGISYGNVTLLRSHFVKLKNY